MVKTETVVLDEDRAAGLRRAIEADSRMVGLLPAIHERRIVGIVVEADSVEIVPDAENAPRRPKK